MAASMSTVEVTELFGKLEEIASKFGDLCRNRVSDEVLELIGRKFYVEPENPVSTMRILANYDDKTEGSILLRLQCFNVELKRLKVTGQNIEEAEPFISCLSFYGRRHYFCPGVVLEEEILAIGSNATVEYKYPYPHFRHKHCPMFYTKSSNKQDPVIICPDCHQYKSSRCCRAKKRKVSPDRRSDPRSHLPTCRLTESEKAERQKILNIERKTCKKELKKLKKGNKTGSDFVLIQGDTWPEEME